METLPKKIKENFKMNIFNDLCSQVQKLLIWGTLKKLDS